MSDSYDDYDAKMQLADYAWENRVVKTEHDRAVKLGQAYERGWNAALAQQEPVAHIDHRIHGWPDCFVIRADPPHTSPLYTAPPKKEWVGLTVNEARDFYEKYTDKEALIYAVDKFLEEKNNG